MLKKIGGFFLLLLALGFLGTIPETLNSGNSTPSILASILYSLILCIICVWGGIKLLKKPNDNEIPDTNPASFERLQELHMEKDNLISENEQLRQQLEKLQTDRKSFESENEELKQQIHAFNSVQNNLKTENEQLKIQLQDLHADEYLEIKKRIDLSNHEIQDNNATIVRIREEIASLSEQSQKLSKQIATQQNKLSHYKELYKSMEYCLSNFFVSDVAYSNCKLDKVDFEELELISPSVTLKLHSMDTKELRKAYRNNEKQINELLNQYETRYTTKSNKSIYDLMVIALRSELQNILYNLKYSKLEDSITSVKTVSAKYLKIAGEGNQSIAGTLTKFIGELEYFFINAVKIEYNYYVKKEQIKQEQLALKEQMRQESEERKALEIERKKIENEETKFNKEISKLEEQLSLAKDEELEKLNARILELQSQLADVTVKKEEISNLANGKAGNVYIISNLGSFGENVFKIGMTRRLDPQDRINELGSASVPFKFDVHSFIFSDDAVALENKLHTMLNEKRVNKVNMRKEFFYTTLEELESIVESIDPTAEFNKTMLAEEFRQSQDISRLTAV